MATILRAAEPRPFLRSPDEHALALHPRTAPGLVTLAFRDGRRWRQRFLHPEELPEVARTYTGLSDVYLTQNRFRGPRSVLNLLHMGALWADLDYYRSPFSGLEPWAVRDAALRVLQEEGLPAPGLSIATGRGVALVWRHAPVPRAALPRWQACQRRLYEALRRFGADRLALDPARVLRLIGTRNSRTGTLVEALSPLSEAWDFEALAGEILPLSRGELARVRSLNAARASKAAGDRPRPSRELNAATYWEAVLSDLQALREYRWMGPLCAGHRDAWMFLGAVALSWFTPAVVLQREVADLARTCASWSEAEASSCACSVLARARAAAKGETLVYQGKRVDPRYRFRVSTAVEWLGITEEEMRGARLRVLVSPDVARERQRQRWHQRQAAAGRGTGLDRQSYRLQAQDRRQEAAQLRAEGLSWAEVGARLGVSAKAALNLAGRAASGGCPKSSRCMVAKPRPGGAVSGS